MNKHIINFSILFFFLIHFSFAQTQLHTDTISLKNNVQKFQFNLPNASFQKLQLYLYLQINEDCIFDKQEFISLQINNPSQDAKIKQVEFARIYLPSYTKQSLISHEIIYDFDMELWQEWLKKDGEIIIKQSGKAESLKASLNLEYEEGEPLSNLLQIIPLWQSDLQGFSYEEQLHLSTNDIPLPQDISTAYIQVLVSGQHTEEFCHHDDAHFYFIHINGKEMAKREIWRDDCGFNPIFPQADLWYDSRPNWCPGLKVNPFAHMLSKKDLQVDTLQASLSFQENFENNEGIESYITSAVLFLFDKPEKKLNASIQKIMAPNTNLWHHRYNPICNNPIILIQNNGQDSIHSITFDYGYNYQNDNKFRWRGELSYLEQELVYLPAPNWYFYENQDIPHSFTVHISSINGKEEAYVMGSRTSEMELAPIYPKEIKLQLKTDHKAQDLSLEIYNDNGDIIFQESDFKADSLYAFPLHLQYGCYEIILSDFEQNGIETSDHSASLKIIDATNDHLIKEFHGDFGSQLREQFMILR